VGAGGPSGWASPRGSPSPIGWHDVFGRTKVFNPSARPAPTFDGLYDKAVGLPLRPWRMIRAGLRPRRTSKGNGIDSGPTKNCA
jgi:hypothetical protein